SQMILGPVAGQLEKRRLLIVSDGALQYVPFAALPKPEAGGKAMSDKPLIVDHEVVNLPSASSLAVLRRELAGRKTARRTVAVLADPVFDHDDERLKGVLVNRGAKSADITETRSSDPLLESDLARSARDFGFDDGGFRLPRLPFTRKEGQAILALIPAGERLSALDFAANQTIATSAELSQYRYVHFATHGLLNEVHPELSGIVLSLIDEKGEEQDGFLRTQEVFNLHL